MYTMHILYNRKQGISFKKIMVESREENVP